MPDPSPCLQWDGSGYARLILVCQFGSSDNISSSGLRVTYFQNFIIYNAYIPLNHVVWKQMDVESIVDGSCIFNWILQSLCRTKDWTSSISVWERYFCVPSNWIWEICYNLLPLIFDRLNPHISLSSVILVVSPLVSLIKDQVRALESRGISVCWTFYDETRDINIPVSPREYIYIYIICV